MASAFDFGPHSDAVEEVVNFFRYGELLTGAAPAASLDVVVTDRRPPILSEAMCGGVPPEEWDGDDDQGLTYDDLLSNTIADANARVERRFRDVIGRIFGGDEALITIGRRLPVKDYPEAGWILGNLYYCALNRCAFGVCDSLHETLFQVYLSGGWPVGWTGRFPDAVRLLALYPNLPRFVDREPPELTYQQWLAEYRRSSDFQVWYPP